MHEKWPFEWFFFVKEVFVSWAWAWCARGRGTLNEPGHPFVSAAAPRQQSDGSDAD